MLFTDGITALLRSTDLTGGLSREPPSLATSRLKPTSSCTGSLKMAISRTWAVRGRCGRTCLPIIAGSLTSLVRTSGMTAVIKKRS